MPYEMLTLTVADRVATVTVNRPDKLNALNAQTISELGTAIDECRGRADVGAILLTGAGRAFVAGADIQELAAVDVAAARRLAERGQAVFARFADSPKPTLAAVNGFALGGGCELALACHMRIASEHAKFGQPEVKLGTIPGYGGTQRLPRLVGEGRAIQMLLTGEIIDASEAFRIGLVSRLAPAAELLSTGMEILRQTLANGPLAVARCIEIVREGLSMPLDQALRREAAAFGDMAATADMREGTAAFLQKRPPAFKGV